MRILINCRRPGLVIILAAILVIASAILIWESTRAVAERLDGPNPAPRIIADLSQFKGRILNFSEVHAGTFTIERSFSEVMTWGEDSILTVKFRGQEGPDVLLEAWRPDPLSNNIFQHAVFKYTHPWTKNMVRDRIIQDRVVKLTLKKTSESLHLKLAAGYLCLILGCVVIFIARFESKARDLVKKE